MGEREGEQMGQPSGGWRKSDGDEKKREGAPQREREGVGEMCVRVGGFM